MEYDVIGDIHGKATLLEALLAQLGYTQRWNGWQPPSGRQAVFLGDLIDRGDEQIRVVDTVRRMVDNGHARCILGNHELNAIGWATPDPDHEGEHLRRHSAKNGKQHAAFLDQVGEGSPRHRDMVGWFSTLPPALDLGGIRAVHAWWNPPYVDLVRERQGEQALEGDLLQEAFREGGALCEAYEGLTKGYELQLPEGAFFLDKEQHRREAVRTQWWREDARTYRDASVMEDAQREQVPELPLPFHYRPTPVAGSPVFVGHYWLEGALLPRCDKVACLDYSAVKGGPLVAYRWQGENVLSERHFVAVR